MFPIAPPGEATRKSARECLGFHVGAERPGDPRLEQTWGGDSVEGEEISWSVGYGPRTHAWVLKPKGAKGQLPGVVALHDHGHYKPYGKEKIADGPRGPLPALEPLRRTFYGGQAYANELAREGFVVLVPDAFLFGSRKFPFEAMPDTDRALASAVEAVLGPDVVAPDSYNGAAYAHEHVVSKYCTLIGTSLAAVVAYEDRVALAYLRARPDVEAARVASIGLSGGGLRSALFATSDDLGACAIVGMMTSYEGLLDNCVATHTWMLFPPGWSHAATGRISPLRPARRRCSFSMRSTIPCSPSPACAPPTRGSGATTGASARPQPIGANFTRAAIGSTSRCSGTPSPGSERSSTPERPKLTCERADASSP